jgi:hypothetical protein
VPREVTIRRRCAGNPESVFDTVQAPFRSTKRFRHHEARDDRSDSTAAQAVFDTSPPRLRVPFQASSHERNSATVSSNASQ